MIRNGKESVTISSGAITGEKEAERGTQIPCLCKVGAPTFSQETSSTFPSKEAPHISTW